MSKVMLITHTDLDGVGCAILAYLAYGRENVDVEYCDYDNVNEKVEEFIEQEELFKSYDTVFITDISVSDDVANMIDALDTLSRRVHLFDHHDTAIYLNAYEWCQVLTKNPFINIKTSGTELFYRYLRCYEPFDHLSANTIENIHRFVGIVRDYDTWRWKELGEEGVICKQVNDLFYIYGREKFIRWAMHQIYTYHEPRKVDFDGKSLVVLESEGYSFPWFSEMDRTLLEQKQKDIDIYIEQKNKQLFTQLDSFGNKYGVVFAERYFSELGNRLCEMHPELSYVAMIDISRGAVSYRTIREDIDVGGEIAHSYGGGGHQKAAGSSFDVDSVQEDVLGLIFSDSHI